MEVGKLYKCSKYYLMIYPEDTPELLSLFDRERSTRLASAEASATHWSRQMNCKVHYSKPDEVFMCLKHEGKVVHVLFGDIKGLIIADSEIEFERLL